MLGDLPLSSDPRVLVDYRTSDDAGVYLIDEDRALVQTVDFFTPIVAGRSTFRSSKGRELAAGNAPGGTKANVAHFGPHAQIDALVPPDFLTVLYDPQTSGGLLVAVDPGRVDEAMSVLGQSGTRSALVGHCAEKTGCHVVVEWDEPRT